MLDNDPHQSGNDPHPGPPPFRGREVKTADAQSLAGAGRVLLGEIGGAVGLKGEVRLRSYTENPADIASYGTLEDERGAQAFEIEELRVSAKALVARINGVATREDAEALSGTKLFVPRDRLPPREADEWYHADLIGLEARSPGGKPLGTVVSVQNFGAGDLLEIRPASGGSNVFLPFTETTVPEVNLDRQQLTVVPPEGLFDEV